MRLSTWRRQVENDYIGSPCGMLDQIMILFAREGMGTHYNPPTRSISYVPLGADAGDFRIVGLDTGTVRPGLEKSTYKIRQGRVRRARRPAGTRVRHLLPRGRALGESLPAILDGRSAPTRISARA